MKKYETTLGTVVWSELAMHVESVPDPVPLDAPGDWKMIGSVPLELRDSRQVILWFWEAPIVTPAQHCGRKVDGCLLEQRCTCSCMKCEEK